jgi:flagellum-specific peptidoglycan hydrolase FlgJ
MINYNLSRKQQKQVREFKKRAVKDLLYFIFCGMIFTGLVQGSTAAIKSTFKSATHEISSSAKKAFAESPRLTPVPVKQAENWNDFISSAMKIAPIYNYPVKVLLAQAALESNRGLSQYALQRNNYFGMNAVDWDPDQAYWYENQEQAMVDYIITVRSNFPEAWASRENPDRMIELLENNADGRMYATDPNYVYKVTHQAEWRNY